MLNLLFKFGVWVKSDYENGQVPHRKPCPFFNSLLFKRGLKPPFFDSSIESVGLQTQFFHCRNSGYFTCSPAFCNLLKFFFVYLHFCFSFIETFSFPDCDSFTLSIPNIIPFKLIHSRKNSEHEFPCWGACVYIFLYADEFNLFLFQIISYSRKNMFPSYSSYKIPYPNTLYSSLP